MSSVTTVRAGAKVCSGCGNSADHLRRSLCDRCYKKSRRDNAATGVCAGCGRVMRMAGTLGRCRTCTKKGVVVDPPRHPMATDVPAWAVQAAVKDSDLFLRDIYPNVVKRALNKYRYFRDPEELAQEAVSWAWLMFVLDHAKGAEYRPGPIVVYSVKRAASGRGIALTRNRFQDATAHSAGPVMDIFGSWDDLTPLVERGMSPAELVDLL
jgi:hypothetical protein